MRHRSTSEVGTQAHREVCPNRSRPRPDQADRNEEVDVRDDDTVERSRVRGARAADPQPVDPPSPTKQKSTEHWVYRWNDWISSEPVLPGIWRRRDGGFRVRARVVTKKTGQVRGVNRALPDCKSAGAAAAELETARDEVRDGSSNATSSYPHFCDWAGTVFERKVASKAILSAAGRAKWESALRLHLVPAFGPIFMDMFAREDAENWKTNDLLAERETAKDTRRERKLAGKGYSPNTVNTILGVLRQITAEASREFGIRDVMTDVDNVSLRAHRTYTYEDPNSVKPKDVPEFLAQMRIRHPQHYAFAFLG
ncbi:MAG: hypothetical protein NT062_11270 [Proteobacteria bacterium]|nr:hypothetical protein [Pseudomonadota bacterium]